MSRCVCILGCALNVCWLLLLGACQKPVSVLVASEGSVYQPSPEQVDRGVLRPMSREQLRRYLQPGPPMRYVESFFGPPYNRVPNSAGGESFSYLYSDESAEIEGFTIHFNRGKKIVSWSDSPFVR